MINELTNLNRLYGEVLREYYSKAPQAYVIAPFINNDVLEKLLPADSEAIIITSWRSDHLLSGYSSLELYELCVKHNWTLFVNNSLHAKIYSNSLNDCYLGSANVTNAALYTSEGNIECLAYLPDIGATGRIEINRLIATSTLVDERVYQQYLKWFNEIDVESGVEYIEPPLIDDISPFYVSQLPATDDPYQLRRCFRNPNYFDLATEHDLAIYGMTGLESSHKAFFDKLSYNFFNHPFIKLFEQRVKDGPIYFGEAKIWVQSNCVNVPLPHRKDLTELVHNLFNWFETLDPVHYEITIPGKHSECLQYK